MNVSFEDWKCLQDILASFLNNLFNLSLFFFLLLRCTTRNIQIIKIDGLWGLFLKAGLKMYDTKSKCFPVFSDCHDPIYNYKGNQYSLPQAVLLKEDVYLLPKHLDLVCSYKELRNLPIEMTFPLACIVLLDANRFSIHRAQWDELRKHFQTLNFLAIVSVKQMVGTLI